MKQADVVLLGYPVPFPLSPEVRRKNLEIYEAVTSPLGPAMTWVRPGQGTAPSSSQAQPYPHPHRVTSAVTSPRRACLPLAGWS